MNSLNGTKEDVVGINTDIDDSQKVIQMKQKC